MLDARPDPDIRAIEFWLPARPCAPRRGGSTTSPFRTSVGPAGRLVLVGQDVPPLTSQAIAEEWHDDSDESTSESFPCPHCGATLDWQA